MLSNLRYAGIDNFYFQYFQTPAVTEAKLERDVIPISLIRSMSFGHLLVNGSF